MLPLETEIIFKQARVNRFARVDFRHIIGDHHLILGCNKDRGVNMNRQAILGPWLLMNMVMTNQDGGVFYPFGESPTGMIMYDASGYMSYTAMRSGRAKFASGDLAGGTPEEKKAAFEGFDAYFGTYDLDLEERVIIHHVEASKFPNWEGSEQLRYFRVSANQLIIDTPPIQFQDKDWVFQVTFVRPERFTIPGSDN